VKRRGGGARRAGGAGGGGAGRGGGAGGAGERRRCRPVHNVNHHWRSQLLVAVWLMAAVRCRRRRVSLPLDFVLPAGVRLSALLSGVEGGCTASTRMRTKKW